MSLSDDISGILNQYSNHQAGQTPATAEQDFDMVARNAPPAQISSGLAEAFRSDQTPPFGSMLGQMFGNSNGNVKAGILNMLIGAVGPQLLAGALSRYNASEAPQGSGGQITPEQADRIPPSAVQEMAEQAHKQDPSIVDQASEYYAQHPTLVKTLGAAALGVALHHLSGQKRGGWI
jgi:hypothetical protein